MIDRLYALYLAAFPYHPVTRQLFEKKLLGEGVKLLTEEREGELCGFALLDGNAVTLLAVSPAFRGRGIGSALLSACEKAALCGGFSSVRLGQGKHYLFQGVPCGLPEGDAFGFFEKRGYSAPWESEDMGLSLGDYREEALRVVYPDAVSFSYAGAEDHKALPTLVARVNPNWVRYFTPDRTVLLAKEGGETVGFAILEEGYYALDNSVGSVGCVGVLPERRRQGIGRALVARAVTCLKERGYTACELRYVSSADFYSPLGFTVTRRFLMAEKSL